MKNIGDDLRTYIQLLLMLKQSASLRKLVKIGQKWGIKNISTGHAKIKVIFVH